MGKNAIVGQSGGPTSVINASLAGVFESCKSRGAEIVYGMCNGVAGLLEERVVDLSTVLTDDLDIELLKRTPSSFLGSCRYKLPDWHEDETVYKKLFAILEKLNIGYFFYIGGNDSMDTIGKLAEYGERIQSDIRFMGVPKTIDNDLMVTDHTPGYGSAAKYIGVVMKEIIRDATVYGTKYVTVVEIMGRNAGWLTAADIEPDTLFREDRVNYPAIRLYRMARLRLAAERFFAEGNTKNRLDFDAFQAATSDWLDDYALFMALDRNHGSNGRCWQDWPAPLAHRSSKRPVFAAGQATENPLQFRARGRVRSGARRHAVSAAQMGA